MKKRQRTRKTVFISRSVKKNVFRGSEFTSERSDEIYTRRSQPRQGAANTRKFFTRPFEVDVWWKWFGQEYRRDTINRTAITIYLDICKQFAEAWNHGRIFLESINPFVFSISIIIKVSEPEWVFISMSETPGPISLLVSMHTLTHIHTNHFKWMSCKEQGSCCLSQSFVLDWGALPPSTFNTVKKHFLIFQFELCMPISWYFTRDRTGGSGFFVPPNKRNNSLLEFDWLHRSSLFNSFFLSFFNPRQYTFYILKKVV